jgi:uncharacterized protein (DUF433 family)
MPTKPSVVHSDPEILSGTPVFIGTRVPVQSLFDYLRVATPSTSFSASFRRSSALRQLPPSNSLATRC